MIETQDHEIQLPSPAKLNLFLHILGKRQDGYHELQTVFQILDYGDELRISLRMDGKISLSPEDPRAARTRKPNL